MKAAHEHRRHRRPQFAHRPLLGAQGWIVAPAAGPASALWRSRQWLRRNRTRHEIAELDEDLLRDIG